jgi:haloacid dehalogenase superfamily, subfamily IA, variant 3 with third motif having DD or ED
MPARPAFIYLDVGNVLVSFDHSRGLRQIAAASGVELPTVEGFFHDRDLQQRLEAGEVRWAEAHAEFCRLTGATVPLASFSRAAGDIFNLRTEMLPVLAALWRLRLPVGLLSNSCEPHWQFICGSGYALLPRAFSIVVLSHEIAAAKPDPAIYAHAVAAAGVAPERIFFCDDIEPNVAAARTAGWDAEVFVSANRLVADLGRRGLNLGL